jgi:hypothetical protein
VAIGLPASHASSPPADKNRDSRDCHFGSPVFDLAGRVFLAGRIFTKRRVFICFHLQKRVRTTQDRLRNASGSTSKLHRLKGA